MKKDIRYKFIVHDFKSAMFIVETLSRLDLLVLTCFNKSPDVVRSDFRSYTIYFDKKSRLVKLNCNDLFTLSFDSFIDAVYFVYVK